MANGNPYMINIGSPFSEAVGAFQQARQQSAQQERQDTLAGLQSQIYQQRIQAGQAETQREAQRQEQLAGFREFRNQEGYDELEAAKQFPLAVPEIQEWGQYRTELRERGGQKAAAKVYNLAKTGDREGLQKELEGNRQLIDTLGEQGLTVDRILEMDDDQISRLATGVYRQAGGNVEDLTGKQIDPYQQAQLDIKKSEQEERKLDRQLTRETNQLKREQIQQEIETTRKLKEQKQINIYNQHVDQLDTLGESINTVDRVLFHPGREAATGFTGAFPTLPGGEAAGFEAQLETLQSQSFLTAVQQLKGLGALSEKEGDKLQSSVGALKLTMPEEEFTRELQRIRTTLTKAMTKARQRMPEEPEALAKRRQLDRAADEGILQQQTTQPAPAGQPAPATRGAMLRQQRQQAEAGYSDLWGG